MDSKLATYPISRLLVHYAIPSILAMGATAVYNLCDSIFLGRYVGPMALAAMALTFPVMNVLGAVGSMINIGGSAQTAVLMGKNDRTQANAILAGVMKMGLCTGMLSAILGFFFLEPLMWQMGASKETLPYAMSYMQIIMPGMIITHTMQGMTGQLRASGNPNSAMKVQLIAVGLNLLFDALFIPILGLGTRGAANATVLAQAIAWCYAAHKFTGGRCWVQFASNNKRLDWRVLRSILTVGISPLIMNLCGCIVVMIINHSLLRYGGELGDLCIGVYGIQNRITALLIMCVSGFGQGMQPIVGYNLGACLTNRVRETLYTCIRIAVIVMLLGYVVIFTFANELAEMFTEDTTLISLSVTALRISLFTLPFVGIQMVVTSFYQAIRKASVSIHISLLRQIVFLIPMLFILPQYIGVNGVWWAMPVADILAFWIVLYYLKRVMRFKF